MSSIGDEEPPDRGGTPSPLTWNPAQIPDSAARAVAKPGNKRPATIQLENADVSKKNTSPSASKQHTFVRPGYENGSDLKYSDADSGPFVVLVSHMDSDIRGLKMAQIIYNGKVAGIKEMKMDNYKLPTIQCHKCCRFGHIKDQCRSNPRCARCAQNHPATDCSVPDSDVTCLFCSGPHAATDSRCPEFSRQRSIKTVMSTENIGYVEAARRFRPVRTSYADKAKMNSTQGSQQPPSYEDPLSSQMSHSQSSLGSPSQRPHSYTKTITMERRPRPPPENLMMLRLTELSRLPHSHHSPMAVLYFTKITRCQTTIWPI
ncbi:hypothetical protein MSG28_009515 [Choristoneura fumiferana]|uniref:Uncharacterized protein n=1 Tax=Choristoneura fumiferana TaxID=7141 RepID=A0ACC0JBJ5_CHOFU|nr:hypothetical protein MSG28_009515 [Choristoneura fumiferana]